MEIDYAAGLFDGEGSFSIGIQVIERSRRPFVFFRPRMSLGLIVGGEVLDDVIVPLLGGRSALAASGMTQWAIYSRDGCRLAAEILTPHLRIKRRIGERFLEALALFPADRRRPVDGRAWQRENAVRVAEIAVSLNERARSRDHMVAAVAAVFD